MFEGIAVNFLNRFFGDYFENVDLSQLMVSLWGGDVILKDLYIKSSALDNFKLPFQVITGKIGMLQMSIPWKTIYVSPLEIVLEDILLILAPVERDNSPYDPKVEAQIAMTKKLKELEEIERLRKLEQEAELEGTTQQGDTYLEKLAMLIIRNLQIRIENVHVLYKDDITDPGNPFNFGLILRSIKIQSTDGSWLPRFVAGSTPSIQKLMTIKGLGLYMNSNEHVYVTRRMSGGAKDRVIKRLKSMVVGQEEPNTLKYLIGPLTTELKCSLNPSPELSSPPFLYPKVSLAMKVQELLFGVTNTQFKDMMKILDNLKVQEAAKKWKKYRPRVRSYRGFYKEWWHFAGHCILARLRQHPKVWHWLNIKRHRYICRTYNEAYHRKLVNESTGQPVPQDVQLLLDSCEKALDNFNIVLVRKQVEMRVARSEKYNLDRQWNSTWGGKVYGWFWPSSVQGQETPEELAQRFNGALSKEEKSKLFKAMRYNETPSKVEIPPDFVDFSMSLTLENLTVNFSESVTVTDPRTGICSSTEEVLLKLSLTNFESKFETRPVNKGLTAQIKMEGIDLDGFIPSPDGGFQSRHLIRRSDEGHVFLQMTYEKAPIGSLTRDHVHLRAQALEVIYHAASIIRFVTAFEFPSEVRLNELLESDQIERVKEWKDISKAKLQKMIPPDNDLYVDIDIKAPYIVIPEKGDLTPEASVLLIDLGELIVKTESREHLLDLRRGQEQLNAQGGTRSDDGFVLDDTNLKLYYGTYIMELKDFQILLAGPGVSFDNYKSTSRVGSSCCLSRTSVKVPDIIFKSDSLLLRFRSSLVTPTKFLPKFLIRASLALVDLEITEHRVLQLTRIITTLPLPFKIVV